jgi:hypothetical protein
MGTIDTSSIIYLSLSQALQLTPVILVSWDAEIGTMVVQGQPKQKRSYDPISTNKKAECGGTCLSYKVQGSRLKTEEAQTQDSS